MMIINDTTITSVLMELNIYEAKKILKFLFYLIIVGEKIN